MSKGKIFEFEGDVTAEQVTDDFDCQCPGCEGTYATGRELASGEPVMLHSWPYCDDFRDLDLGEFLSAQAQHAVDRLCGLAGEIELLAGAVAPKKKDGLPN